MVMMLLLGSAEANYVLTNLSDEIVPSCKYPSTSDCGYNEDSMSSSTFAPECETWCGNKKWCLFWSDSAICGSFEDATCSNWEDSGC